jgi:prephenate dehydratase
MRIAYHTEPGAYSESAAILFNEGAEPIACKSFDDVFAVVERGQATHGIVPIENTIRGSIHRNYDLLFQHDLPVVGEVQLRITHSLLGPAGMLVSDVRRLYSDPQTLSECEGFVRGLGNVEVVAMYDAAAGARAVQEAHSKDAAAIASDREGRKFGLEVLKPNVQDNDDNLTRFLIVGRGSSSTAAPGADKTTIVFSLPSQPGALFKALSVFALRDIDMTKLESRPIHGRPFEYMFYADLAVSRDDMRCARALVHLAEFAPWVRTLGSYRAWKPTT